MSNISRQLYLFDCDGGRGNLFSELKRSEIPKNYELYLFWNDNDEIITERLHQLSTYPNVHLAPSHLKNVKNSADGKLIYFLGKFAHEFHNITIIGGGDCVYEEVIEAVKYDHPQKNVTLRKIEHPNSRELELLLGLPPVNIQSNSTENGNKSINKTLQSEPSAITRSIQLTVGQSTKCPECPNRKDTYSPCGLRMHLLTSRKHSKKIIAVSKVPQSVKENKMFCPNGQVKLIHPSIEKALETPKKGKKCPLCPSSKQKYKGLSIYKHLKSDHAQCANVQIKCCDENVTYNDLNLFRQHVFSLPIIITYKIQT
jgi:hypothetical protein